MGFWLARATPMDHQRVFRSVMVRSPSRDNRGFSHTVRYPSGRLLRFSGGTRLSTGSSGAAFMTEQGRGNFTFEVVVTRPRDHRELTSGVDLQKHVPAFVVDDQVG